MNPTASNDSTVEQKEQAHAHLLSSKSLLLPAMAMAMSFGPWFFNSSTQFFNVLNVDARLMS